MNPMRILGQDLALDLGAASTQIYARKRGIVINEPSLVVRCSTTGKVIGYGADTPAGTGPEPVAIRPVVGGVPADVDLTTRMIRHFLRKVHGHPFSRPRMVIALPADSTGFAGNALRDLAFQAEARRVYLVHHGLAAALGAGLPVREAAGNMIIDIGRDTTRIAVVSCASVVHAATVQSGGADVNRAIVAQVKHDHGLDITEQSAEVAKRGIGSAWRPVNRTASVRGVDRSGRTGIVAISAGQVYEATRQTVTMIVRAAREVIERCSPDLAADVADRGAVLTGGGALMRGLARRLRLELEVPVQRAERPVETVALGLGRCVDDIGRISRDTLMQP
ncbi:rod shape-determining protein [Nonomuraea endophytica]|uniref:Rod shape-determining protein MreB n=1 Tax=Nonomuraea endophytica TaxID=714136 RepID=A0A7W8A0R5_9ACTN|nr:rod shape-determining protein [Nonomuraea endophytica]MBB5076641.1 rod shape-determining protein MreB [Nonomuraea endophytica]